MRCLLLLVLISTLIFAQTPTPTPLPPPTVKIDPYRTAAARIIGEERSQLPRPRNHELVETLEFLECRHRINVLLDGDRS